MLTNQTELEEKNFKVKLTIIDTPGFGDYVNNHNSWMPIYEFLDDQHESFMAQEQQPTRKGAIDMRVHACLYFIRPSGHTWVLRNFWWENIINWFIVLRHSILK